MSSTHRRKLILSVALVPVLTVVMQWCEFAGLMAGPEGMGLNLLLRGPGATSQQVFIVQITDEDYVGPFERKSPLPPDKVKELLRRVARLKPKVMGVDILTDSPAYSHDLDRELRQAGAGEVVWIAPPTGINAEPVSFPAWIVGGHPHVRLRIGNVLNAPSGESSHAPPYWGVPYFPVSEDLRIKLFPRHVELASNSDPLTAPAHGSIPSPLTFAQEVYRRYLGEARYQPHGHHAEHEVFMNFTGERFRFAKLSAGDLLSEQITPEPIRRQLEGRIVLVGGVFEEARDSYETPLGRLSGLEINAFAVETNLGDGGVGEIARPLAILFDLVFGYLVVFVFNYRTVHDWRPLPRGLLTILDRVIRDEIRWKVIASMLTSLAGAFLFSYTMFRSFDVWASYLGVFAGVIFHQIVEVIIENPGAESNNHHA